MRIGTGNSEDLPGMGLGLSLVKKIIRKQGGDIWYEAKENGSNFVFTLPINGVRGTSR
jgi:signal transduction histidine kinase